MEHLAESGSAVRIRASARRSDVDAVSGLHARLYRADDGFGPRFVEYATRGVAELVEALERDAGAGRLWLVDVGDQVCGSIAIVRTAPRAAQLRWFLLAPELRGQGLGRRLLTEALAYTRREGYERVFLLTVKGLDRAARLYRAAGFALTDERLGTSWGDQLVEQRYVLRQARGDG